MGLLIWLTVGFLSAVAGCIWFFSKMEDEIRLSHLLLYIWMTATVAAVISWFGFFVPIMILLMRYENKIPDPVVWRRKK